MAILIVAAVAWVFRDVLNNTDLQQDVDWKPAWLAAAGGVYLIGLAFSAWFWRDAIRSLGGDPDWITLVRAYYVGHLGKYVPGKTLLIIMRTAMMHGPKVRTSVAVVTMVYETLIFMAAGALVAALLLAVRAQSDENRLWQALLLLACADPAVGFQSGVPTDRRPIPQGGRSSLAEVTDSDLARRPWPAIYLLALSRPQPVGDD
jgi:uncharacterized membrane protein YbhN (UPF0104 family)